LEEGINGAGSGVFHVKVQQDSPRVPVRPHGLADYFWHNVKPLRQVHV
jgi:hypothetical protein